MLVLTLRKTVTLNLNRFQPAHTRVGGNALAWDSSAAMTTLDYAVSQQAFVLDHQPHCHGRASGPGATPSNCSAQPPFGTLNEEDELLLTIFSKLDPLFSAYGWADSEYAWTNITARSGGTVFCTNDTPNLSFWARLACDSHGRRKAR